MSVNQRQIAAFIEENFTDSEGVTLDYLTLSEPSSVKKRSWRECASIRVGDRELTAIVSEVSKHVTNILESAKEGGSDEVAIKVNLYRNKEAAGSRTWREEIEQETEEKPEENVTSNISSVVKNIVETNNQLRSIVLDLVSKNTAMAMKGYELAHKAMEAKQAAENDAAEMRTLLAVSQVEGNSTQDEIVKMGAAAMVDVVKTIAINKANEAANNAKQIEAKGE